MGEGIIERSTIWRTYEAIPMIMKSLLDPSTILTNPEVYKKVRNGRLISFLSIRDRGNHKELGTVYTRKEYRGQGHATHLIEKVLRKTEVDVYLLCQEHLKGFYEKFGFEPIDSAPIDMELRRKAANLINIFLNREWTIVMGRRG
ncbi:MAG: GNAT family N-acetyltransferase [Candidatus Nanohaloarchaea archaeon]|nr:GNAT family N-acetyltransferase [Candidatus Nanohaloarchaea archaeon]